MDDYSVASAPTHYLAVYQPAPSYPYDPAKRVTWKFNFRRNVNIYPICSLVFVAHCSNFPRIIPESDPVLTLCAPETAMKLPVIPLRIPRTKQFPIIMQYLYSQDWRQFAYNLIPVLDIPDIRDTDPLPTDSSSPFMHIWNKRHAQQVVEQLSPALIPAMKDHIYGIYMNMVALGISDRKMWQVLCFCYDTALLVELLRQRKDMLLKIMAPSSLPRSGPSGHKPGTRRLLPSNLPIRR